MKHHITPSQRNRLIALFDEIGCGGILHADDDKIELTTTLTLGWIEEMSEKDVPKACRDDFAKIMEVCE